VEDLGVSVALSVRIKMAKPDSAFARHMTWEGSLPQGS
jgi:hypothetical protein